MCRECGIPAAAITDMRAALMLVVLGQAAREGRLLQPHMQNPFNIRILLWNKLNR